MLSLFGKTRDHGEMGTRNPGGLPEGFQGGSEDAGVTLLPRCFT